MGETIVLRPVCLDEKIGLGLAFDPNAIRANTLGLLGHVNKAGVGAEKPWVSFIRHRRSAMR